MRTLITHLNRIIEGRPPVSDDAPENRERREFLLAERIRYVLNDPTSSLMTNMALGMVLCFLLKPMFDVARLLIWVACLLMACLLRVSLAQLYAKHADKFPSRYWMRLYFAGTVLSALVWSSTSLFFFHTGSFDLQVYLVAILAGLVHGAGHSQAPFRRLHVLYAIIVMGPLIFRFFAMGSFFYGTFAFTLIFLFAALSISTRRMHRILMWSLDMRYDMSQLALIDALTGVANRRHFDIFIYQEWRKAQREDTPMAMLMVDVDFFKLYNDIYGHQSGDQCLRSIARAISGVIHRPSDLVARYGGEEFSVILPNTPLRGAMKIAELIRQEVGALFIEHRKSTVAHYVTVSVGVAVISPGQENHLNELVSAADEALYKAKETGRNRIYVHLAEPREEGSNVLPVSR
ncbi:MAG: diguanylate cyclase [Syntrophaceae bacterium]